MIDVDAAFAGVTLFFSSWGHFLIIIPGLVIGLFFGAIPGLSTPMAMAVFLPLTMPMDLMTSLLFLTAMFTGAGFSSAVPAVLINVPGQPSALATSFDGHPMLRSGKANEALGIALAASCIAAAVGYVLLILLIDGLGGLALMLGPPELLIIALSGLLLIGALGGSYPARSIMAGAFGLLVASLGISPRGVLRGTMGLPQLFDGIPVLPAVVGLFMGDLLDVLRSKYLIEDPAHRKMSLRRLWSGVVEGLRYPIVLLRGSLIGVGIGAVPGVGATIGSLVAYHHARNRSKHPEKFGTGSPEGIIAAESANNSAEGGSLATVLLLGIPGGAATAVLLGAITMQGVLAGPRMYSQNKEVVYGILFGNLVQVLVLLVLGLAFCYLAASVVMVPTKLVVPTVMALATFGAFSMTANFVGPVTMAAFCLLGWLMVRFHFSIPSMVVGLVLGSIVEGALLRSYGMSNARLSFFFERRPISVVLALVGIAFISWSVYRTRRRRARLELERQ